LYVALLSRHGNLLENFHNVDSKNISGMKRGASLPHQTHQIEHDI
jgi:hypothetical protein